MHACMASVASATDVVYLAASNIYIKAHKLDMITLGNHAPRSYMTWLLMTLTWLPMRLLWPWHDYLLYNLQFKMLSKGLISKIPCMLSANQKRDSELNVITWLNVLCCTTKIYNYCFISNCTVASFFGSSSLFPK